MPKKFENTNQMLQVKKPETLANHCLNKMEKKASKLTKLYKDESGGLVILVEEGWGICMEERRRELGESGTC